MLIVLSLFSILFISWLLFICLSEKTSQPNINPYHSNPAQDVHDKLDQLNTILEIEENPEKAE